MYINKWLERYIEIVNERFIYNEIKEKTLTEYMRSIKKCSELFGNKLIDELSVKDIATEVSKIINSGRNSTAYRFKIHLVDMFREAQHEGVVVAGHNPAQTVRTPRRKVKTQRLTFEEWKLVLYKAKNIAPSYFYLSMLLALLTAQRITDITRMTHKNIRNEYLYIDQQKTGVKIAIPLSLRLDLIDISLSDVLSMCPRTGSLLQHENGKSVNTWTLSRWFKICRNAALSKASGLLPPPFREQRSLAERLYRKQGVDTMILLGHKHQYTTDNYNDIRNKDYRFLTLK